MAKPKINFGNAPLDQVYSVNGKPRGCSLIESNTDAATSGRLISEIMGSAKEAAESRFYNQNIFRRKRENPRFSVQIETGIGRL